LTDFPGNVIHDLIRMSTGNPQQFDPTERLLSLDVLRGFDMFWIVFGEVFVWSMVDHTDWNIFELIESQLEHPEWHGFTFYDLVFPLFMFIAGVSFPFSLAKRLERGESISSLHWHIIWRGVLLVLLGSIRKHNGILTFDFEKLIFPSVLGRIGLGCMFGSLIALHTRWRGQLAWAVGILAGYWAAMELIPIPEFGAGDHAPGHTLACYVDSYLFPGQRDGGRCHSEGLLSTFPAIVNVIAGILTGQWLIRGDRTGYQKTAGMALLGVVALGIGMCWDIVFPVNKTLWTSSFVMVTVGCSLLLLALFYLVIDVWKFRRGMLPLIVIGVNPLLIYMADGLIDFDGIADVVFGHRLYRVHPVVAECSGLALAWFGLYVLYRKRIFWRV
jgi:predicted acyltransferase